MPATRQRRPGPNVRAERLYVGLRLRSANTGRKPAIPGMSGLSTSDNVSAADKFNRSADHSRRGAICVASRARTRRFAMASSARLGWQAARP